MIVRLTAELCEVLGFSVWVRAADILSNFQYSKLKYSYCIFKQIMYLLFTPFVNSLFSGIALNENSNVQYSKIISEMLKIERWDNELRRRCRRRCGRCGRRCGLCGGSGE